MKIVISGSKGFVGQNLMELFKDKKYEVIEIDISNGFDLSNLKNCESVCDFDIFVHLANLVYVPASYENPEKFYRINFMTTLNALELCRKYNARLIYVSSYLYGNPHSLPITEMHNIIPTNPYANSKYICEKLIEGYCRDFDIKATILRPFNIYGVGQRGNLLMPEIISQLNAKNKNIYLKDPFPQRDYVNVKDVARALKMCVDSYTRFGIYNICSGKSYSVKEVTEIVNTYLKFKVSFYFANSDRPCEINETLGSYQKLYDDYGWEPLISFEDGIRDIVISDVK